MRKVLLRGSRNNNATVSKAPQSDSVGWEQVNEAERIHKNPNLIVNKAQGHLSVQRSSTEKHWLIPHGYEKKTSVEVMP